MMLSLLAETATGALGDGCAGIAFMSNFGDCDSYAKTNHAYCVDDVDIIFPKCSAQVACPDECKQVEVVPGSTCATIAFDAGYGSCSTYNVIDGINRPFCALDKDMGHTECTAAASCDECKNQPAVKKDPSTDSKTCANIVFDAAFGLCDSYAHWPNHGYCQHDTDHYYNCKAADSCKECAPQVRCSFLVFAPILLFAHILLFALFFVRAAGQARDRHVHGDHLQRRLRQLQHVRLEAAQQQVLRHGRRSRLRLHRG
jgi:hypothetical protein